MEETEIRKWVESNARGLIPDTQWADGDLDHVAMCLHHIYRWYHEGYPIGDFLTAVVRDEFSSACFQADGTNKKALYLYALFLANKIPDDYRLKACGKSRGKVASA